MWTCPNCNRVFKTTNQSHTCNDKEVGELFLDRPDELVLAYADLIDIISEWTPFSQGTAKNTIVVTSKKAWLIIHPMKKELDLKFYYGEPISSPRVKKIGKMGKKFGHHIRIQQSEELDETVMELLRKGFDFSLQ
ncbi:MAG: DUF5655 domain-containing protein [Bacteroidota bacterium]